MDFRKYFSSRSTPQSQSIPGSDQVPNSAGGYSWAVDDWQQLERFLILGTEGGTYYIGEPQLTIENAEAVLRCIKADGLRAVGTIVEISKAGRAPKNDPALFALAMAAGLGDTPTRQAALEALPQVARIGTHLFTFMAYVGAFRGRGRALRRALQNWYTDKDVSALAYQVVKYRQRMGWSHRDVLRIGRPQVVDGAMNDLLHWITQGNVRESLHQIPIIDGYLKASEASSASQVAQIIRDYRLPREAVPTNFLTDKEVWLALLDDMPMTALIRNLGNLGKAEVLVPGAWDSVEQVVKQLGDVERLQKARVHPIQILSALMTYSGGQGVRGSGEWKPVSQITDALDKAFYDAFQFVEPTNKRWLLGLDVSGSMSMGRIAGIPNLTPRLGAAVMSMVTARTEAKHAFVAFSDKVVPFDISRSARLQDVAKKMDELPFGRTDCAQPMLYGLKHRIEVDAFVVYTDNETWFGEIHPAQALQQYREKTGIPAKLIVVAMQGNNFSIADPGDPGMLDVVGFDTGTPQAIAEFAKM